MGEKGRMEGRRREETREKEETASSQSVVSQTNFTAARRSQHLWARSHHDNPNPFPTQQFHLNFILKKVVVHVA